MVDWGLVGVRGKSGWGLGWGRGAERFPRCGEGVMEWEVCKKRQEEGTV